MERQFPKNVRQVGNVSDTPKIYVEDYVDTYLNQLRDKAQEEPVGVFLIGESGVIEGQDCVYISGAVQMREFEEGSTEIKITDEVVEAGRQDCKEYFQTDNIIGWALIKSGFTANLDEDIIKQHEKSFPQKNSVLIVKDPEENEEAIFAYKYHELMQMGGHYVFYEKNPAMQNYMINTRKQIGVTPSEVVEDRAAKDFRSTIREKIDAQEQKSSSRLVYVTSALLVVVVLAIGISAVNNYDKMESVQSSIEALSKTVSQPDKKEETVVVTETEKETASAETQEASQQTDPPVTTVQEELGEKEYYTVEKGDTLDKISSKVYGTTTQVDAICKMNGLTDGNLIFIGQKLLLP